MAGKLSFSVAINLLTENFKRGSGEIRNGLRNIQMQAMTMFAALGAGSLGLGELVSNLIDVARQTNRTSTALKNVSGDWETYGKNQKFLIALSQKYGLYVNDLVGNFAKFTAAATNANMSMKDQQLLFESLSRASTGFGLSADETNGVFLAVTQMMGKGKIQAEELRGQLGERMPIAMQAMARAAGTTVAGLDKIMKAGKLMSADVLPKFAKALNEMMPNVNTDNIETSFNRLKNSFKELTDKLNVGGIYKNLLDQTGQGFQWLMNNFKTAGNAIVNIVASLIIGKAINAIIASYRTLEVTALRFYKKQALMSGVAFDQMAYDSNKFKNIATLAFAKVGVALKAAFASFAPMLIISGLIAIYQHFSDLAEKQREIKAIWTDFQNGYKNAGKNDSQVRELSTLQSIIKDTTKSLDERKTALEQINNILGTNYEFDKSGLKINGDINTKIRERIGLLEKQAELSYLVNAKMKAGDALSESTNKVSEDEKQLEIWSSRAANKDKKGFIQVADEAYQSKVWKDKLNVDLQEKKANEKVYNSASNKVITVTTDIEKITGKPKAYTAPVDTTDKKAKKTDLQKAEEDYTKTLSELNNQKSNGVVTDKEYNRALDELNKETYKKIGGLVKDGSKNKIFKDVKAGVLNPKETEIGKVENDYNDALADLTLEKKLGLKTSEEYDSALKSLINSTVKNIFSNDKIDAASSEFAKTLIAAKKTLDKKDYSLPIKEKVDHTFDYKKNAVEKLQDKKDVNDKYSSDLVEKLKKNTGADDIEQQIKNAKGDLTALNAKFGSDLVGSIAALDEALKNTTSLSDALKLAEVKKDIKDLQKELNNGLYDGVKNIAGSAKNMYEGFKAVSDTISNVDASGFEKFLSIWDALTNTIDGIMSVVKMIENLTTVTTALGLAKQTQAGIEAGVSAAKIATNVAETASFTGLMAAETAAAYAFIPFVGEGLALAQIGVMQGAILAASIPKFANGGIVQGGSISGDKILARVNAGEMILNQGQQSNLFALLNGKGGINSTSSGIGGTVEFKIDGKNLKGVLSNYEKIKSKV